MPVHAPYLFTASMDVRPDKEALFHEVYDREHVPSLLTVPGLVSVARFQLEPLTMSIGGELRTIVAEHEPRFSAVYEIESPEVLLSPAWAKATEEGRWPAQVRPFTKNRRHTLRLKI